MRPENFEDASLVGDARDRGSAFRAKIDVLESLGSELYAHFTVTSDAAIDSAELRELAQDAGGGEIPMEGDEGSIVARLDPASQVKQGEEAELWVDATRLQLFDPEDGRNLMVDAEGPPAVGDEVREAEERAPGGRDAEGRDVGGQDPDANRADVPT
jgi:multiple sugar transport system ATP-binding protein